MPGPGVDVPAIADGLDFADRVVTVHERSEALHGFGPRPPLLLLRLVAEKGNVESHGGPALEEFEGATPNRVRGLGMHDADRAVWGPDGDGKREGRKSVPPALIVARVDGTKPREGPRPSTQELRAKPVSDRNLMVAARYGGELVLNPRKGVLGMRTSIYEIAHCEEAVARGVEVEVGKGTGKRSKAPVHIADHEVAAEVVARKVARAALLLSRHRREHEGRRHRPRHLARLEAHERTRQDTQTTGA